MNVVMKKSGIGFLIMAFLFVLMSMSFNVNEHEHKHIEVEPAGHVAPSVVMLEAPK